MLLGEAFRWEDGVDVLGGNKRVLWGCLNIGSLGAEWGVGGGVGCDFAKMAGVVYEVEEGYHWLSTVGFKGISLEFCKGGRLTTVLVGLKFIQHWPFIGRLRVCFIEPPYVQVTVKPIFHHGLDVADLPGIASWMDKIIDAAFERTLVEPNMLVIDVEKFASSEAESWFTVDVKSPVAFARVEIIEAIEMQPSDSNDSRLRSKEKRRLQSGLKNLRPPFLPGKPVISCPLKSTTKITYLKCSINIIDLRGGQRHDRWVALENIKAGRLHLAITIIEIELERLSDNPSDRDEEATNTGSSSMVQDDSNVITFSEVGKKLSADYIFGTKNIKDEAFISLENREQYESPHHVHYVSPNSSTSSSYSDANCADEIRSVHTHGKIRRGLHKLGAVVHPKSLNTESREHESFKIEKNDHDQTHRSTLIKEKSLDIMKHAGKSAQNFKIRLQEKVRKKPRQEDSDPESCKSDDVYRKSSSSNEPRGCSFNDEKCAMKNVIYENRIAM
ncbi:C2 domain-containing protein [Platanthera guangdongensis]|uniref:C2 domain-containing protein n=1 Tax=Platanthera guangdongensis TaxID=2320717 RepID=A0ABR2LUH1_9ASPA